MDKEELKQIYVSIHTLRMEGDWDNTSVFSLAHQISIHTLRMEGDDSISDKVAAIKAFQSTPSAWRVTQKRTKKPHAFVQSNRPAEKLPTGRA